jgi:hypothetical protein
MLSLCGTYDSPSVACLSRKFYQKYVEKILPEVWHAPEFSRASEPKSPPKLALPGNGAFRPSSSERRGGQIFGSRKFFYRAALRGMAIGTRKPAPI